MLSYCRLCLKTEESMINVITSTLKYSDLNLIDCLYWIFGVEIEVSDPYSKSICKRCADIVQDIGYLRESFKKNQILLTGQLEVLDSILRVNAITNGTCHNSLENKDNTNDSQPPEIFRNLSVPIISVTKLENSSVLENYNKIDNLTYKRKINLNKDVNESSTQSVANNMVKVPIEIFKTCICPSVPISKLEDTTICEEYEKIDDTTYIKVHSNFDLNPDLKQYEIKRLNFIERYYATPTTALRELINEKQGLPSGRKTNLSSVKPSIDKSEPLVTVHDVFRVEVCNYCSKSFKSKQMLTVHCKVKHNALFRKEISDVKKNKKHRTKKFTHTKTHKQNNVSAALNLALTRQGYRQQNLSKIKHYTQNNVIRPNKVLVGIKSKWDNISRLINIKKKKIFTSNYEIFPNLKFIKDQSKENVKDSRQKIESTKNVDKVNFIKDQSAEDNIIYSQEQIKPSKNVQNVDNTKEDIANLEINLEDPPQPHSLQSIQTRRKIIHDIRCSQEKIELSKNIQNADKVNFIKDQSKDDIYSQEQIESSKNVVQNVDNTKEDIANSEISLEDPPQPNSLKSIQTRRNIIHKIRCSREKIELSENIQNADKVNFIEDQSKKDIIYSQEQIESSKNVVQNVENPKEDIANLEISLEDPPQPHSLQSIQTRRKIIHEIRCSQEKIESSKNIQNADKVNLIKDQSKGEDIYSQEQIESSKNVVQNVDNTKEDIANLEISLEDTPQPHSLQSIQTRRKIIHEIRQNMHKRISREDIENYINKEKTHKSKKILVSSDVVIKASIDLTKIRDDLTSILPGLKEKTTIIDLSDSDEAENIETDTENIEYVGEQDIDKLMELNNSMVSHDTKDKGGSCSPKRKSEPENVTAKRKPPEQLKSSASIEDGTVDVESLPIIRSVNNKKEIVKGTTSTDLFNSLKTKDNNDKSTNVLSETELRINRRRSIKDGTVDVESLPIIHSVNSKKEIVQGTTSTDLFNSLKTKDNNDKSTNVLSETELRINRRRSIKDGTVDVESLPIIHSVNSKKEIVQGTTSTDLFDSLKTKDNNDKSTNVLSETALKKSLRDVVESSASSGLIHSPDTNKSNQTKNIVHKLGNIAEVYSRNIIAEYNRFPIGPHKQLGKADGIILNNVPIRETQLSKKMDDQCKSIIKKNVHKRGNTAKNRCRILPYNRHEPSVCFLKKELNKETKISKEKSDDQCTSTQQKQDAALFNLPKTNDNTDKSNVQAETVELTRNFKDLVEPRVSSTLVYSPETKQKCNQTKFGPKHGNIVHDRFPIRSKRYKADRTFLKNASNKETKRTKEKSDGQCKSIQLKQDGVAALIKGLKMNDNNDKSTNGLLETVKLTKSSKDLVEPKVSGALIYSPETNKCDQTKSGHKHDNIEEDRCSIVKYKRYKVDGPILKNASNKERKISKQKSDSPCTSTREKQDAALFNFPKTNDGTDKSNVQAETVELTRNFKDVVEPRVSSALVYSPETKQKCDQTKFGPKHGHIVKDRTILKNASNKETKTSKEKLDGRCKITRLKQDDTVASFKGSKMNDNNSKSTNVLLETVKLTKSSKDLVEPKVSGALIYSPETNKCDQTKSGHKHDNIEEDRSSIVKYKRYKADRPILKNASNKEWKISKEKSDSPCTSTREKQDAALFNFPKTNDGTDKSNVQAETVELTRNFKDVVEPRVSSALVYSPETKQKCDQTKFGPKHGHIVQDRTILKNASNKETKTSKEKLDGRCKITRLKQDDTVASFKGSKMNDNNSKSTNVLLETVKLTKSSKDLVEPKVSGALIYSPETNKCDQTKSGHKHDNIEEDRCSIVKYKRYKADRPILKNASNKEWKISKEKSDSLCTSTREKQDAALFNFPKTNDGTDKSNVQAETVELTRNFKDVVEPRVSSALVYSPETKQKCDQTKFGPKHGHIVQDRTILKNASNKETKTSKEKLDGRCKITRLKQDDTVASFKGSKMNDNNSKSTNVLLETVKLTTSSKDLVEPKASAALIYSPETNKCDQTKSGHKHDNIEEDRCSIVKYKRYKADRPILKNPSNKETKISKEKSYNQCKSTRLNQNSSAALFNSPKTINSNNQSTNVLLETVELTKNFKNLGEPSTSNALNYSPEANKSDLAKFVNKQGSIVDDRFQNRINKRFEAIFKNSPNKEMKISKEKSTQLKQDSVATLFSSPKTNDNSDESINVLSETEITRSVKDVIEPSTSSALIHSPEISECDQIKNIHKPENIAENKYHTEPYKTNKTNLSNTPNKDTKITQEKSDGQCKSTQIKQDSVATSMDTMKVSECESEITNSSSEVKKLHQNKQWPNTCGIKLKDIQGIRNKCNKVKHLAMRRPHQENGLVPKSSTIVKGKSKKKLQTVSPGLQNNIIELSSLLGLVDIKENANSENPKVDRDNNSDSISNIGDRTIKTTTSSDQKNNQNDGHFEILPPVDNVNLNIDTSKPSTVPKSNAEEQRKLCNVNYVNNVNLSDSKIESSTVPTGVQKLHQLCHVNNENLSISESKPSAKLTGTVEEMKKLCKLCTVPLEKLNLEKNILGLIINRNLKQDERTINTDVVYKEKHVSIANQEIYHVTAEDVVCKEKGISIADQEINHMTSEDVVYKETHISIANQEINHLTLEDVVYKEKHMNITDQEINNMTADDVYKANHTSIVDQEINDVTAENLNINESESAEKLTGTVEEMKKLCKLCTVPLEKLDLEQKILGLVINLDLKQEDERTIITDVVNKEKHMSISNQEINHVFTEDFVYKEKHISIANQEINHLSIGDVVYKEKHISIADQEINHVTAEDVVCKEKDISIADQEINRLIAAEDEVYKENHASIADEEINHVTAEDVVYKEKHMSIVDQEINHSTAEDVVYKEEHMSIADEEINNVTAEDVIYREKHMSIVNQEINHLTPEDVVYKEKHMSISDQEINQVTAENLNINESNPAAKLTGTVDEMKKLCKLCTVPLEKLDLEKNILGLVINLDLKQERTIITDVMYKENHMSIANQELNHVSTEVFVSNDEHMSIANQKISHLSTEDFVSKEKHLSIANQEIHHVATEDFISKEKHMSITNQKIKHVTTEIFVSKEKHTSITNQEINHLPTEDFVFKEKHLSIANQEINHVSTEDYVSKEKHMSISNQEINLVTAEDVYKEKHISIADQETNPVTAGDDILEPENQQRDTDSSNVQAWF